jgi:hypothetical protein
VVTADCPDDVLDARGVPQIIYSGEVLVGAVAQARATRQANNGPVFAKTGLDDLVVPIEKVKSTLIL